MYHTDKVFHAEDRGTHWAVYTDLTREEVESVEGVSAVFGDESFCIYLDPRFDADEVMRELHKLALDNYLKDQGGYFPDCGCPICKVWRALDKSECKVEPRVDSCDCKPETHARFGDCTLISISGSYKVYLHGEEITEKTVYKPTEDVTIVSIRDLKEIQQVLQDIRGIATWKGGRIRCFSWDKAPMSDKLASEALDILDEVLP